MPEVASAALSLGNHDCNLCAHPPSSRHSSSDNPQVTTDNPPMIKGVLAIRHRGVPRTCAGKAKAARPALSSETSQCLPCADELGQLGQHMQWNGAMPPNAPALFTSSLEARALVPDYIPRGHPATPLTRSPVINRANARRAGSGSHHLCPEESGVCQPGLAWPMPACKLHATFAVPSSNPNQVSGIGCKIN
jgi:hypothetical protein